MKYFAFTIALILSAFSTLAGITEYEVGPFDQISVRGEIPVVYRANPDSLGYARFESEEDFTSALEISNTNGKLQLKEILSNSHPSPLPTVYVYSDYVVSVENEGGCTLDALIPLTTPTFSARLVGNGKIICRNINSTKVNASIATGNGTIVLTGECVEADFKLTGSGVIQADELVADEIDCKVLGTGSIGCNAVELIDVRGAGTTKIYYTGNPRINKVGGAKLIQMETKTPELEVVPESEPAPDSEVAPESEPTPDSEIVPESEPASEED